MFLAAFFCRFYRVWADFSFLHLLDNCFGFCFSFYLISRNMFMFIVCFIHSFWTCGNQNQWCDYTFCCLPPTSSGQLLWWWQQLSCKVSINLLDWYFSPVDSFPPRKASFSTSLLFAARVRGNLSTHFPETLCQIAAQTLVRISASWAPPQIYVCSSRPLSPLLLCFACLTGYLHAVSSVSLCLPVIASVIMTNTRRGLLVPQHLVSSCCRCDWAGPVC